MPFVEGVATGVFGNAVYGVLVEALKVLRARRSGWDQAMLRALSHHDVKLNRQEQRRLIAWIRTVDLERLRNAPEGPSVELVASLDRDIFRTWDADLAAQQVNPQGWAEANEARALQLAGALWSALLAALAVPEVLAIRSAVAALHTEQIATSVLSELNWLHEDLNRSRMLHVTLPLERAWLRPLPETPLSPYQLLWPRSAIVPFDDRGSWLTELAKWCDRPDRISVQIIHGAGGMGKTRLALELCRHMSARGWLAGIYRQTSSAALAELAAQSVPRLIVIDYADVQPQVARHVLEALSHQLPLRAQRVRVLLLVRRLGKRGDPRRWFTGPSDRVTQLIDNAGLVSLSEQSVSDGTESEGALFGADARRVLYQRALQAFSDHLHATHSAGMPDLTQPTFGSPLFVLMAALLSVGESFDRALSYSSADEILDRVLEREQHTHWKDSPESSLLLQQRAVAIGTLFGANDQEDSIGHLSSDPAWSDDRGMQVRLSYWLHDLYEGARWVNPLEPDLLGEFLVSLHLDDPLLDHAVHLPSSLGAIRALTVLSRLVSTRPQLKDPIERAIRSGLAGLVDAATQEELANPLDPGERLAVPLAAVVEQLDLTPIVGEYSPPRGLRATGSPVAVALGKQAVAHARRLADEQGGRDAHLRLRRTLVNLSLRLGEVGGRAEALSANTEAVDHCRRFAIDADLPMLASDLNMMSVRLADIGKVHEALKAASEAVEICRRLVGQEASSANLAGLSASLNNQCLWLAGVGRLDDALECINDAVAIRRRLAEKDPDAFLELLSDSLDNQSNRLQDLDRSAEALHACREALDNRRRLAKDAPAVFLPDLAGSLVNLSIQLAALGNRSEAAQAAEQAVETYRLLADVNPDAHLPTLATALNSLSLRLTERGDLEAALRAVDERVKLMRDLASRYPAAESDSLGGALTTLANCLFRLGRQTEALGADREAVEIFRGLADPGSPAHEAMLSVALVNMGVHLGAMGRPEEAVAAAEEAVGIRRELYESVPVAHSADLAAALNNFASLLGRVGRHGEATTAASEAVDLRRRLVAAGGHGQRSELARALRTLSTALRAIGNVDASEVAASEASLLT